MKLLPPCRLHICPIFSTSVELPFSQYLIHCPLQKGKELFSARLPADSGRNTQVSKGSSHFCICFAVFTFLLQSVSFLFSSSLSIYIFKKTQTPRMLPVTWTGFQESVCLFVCLFLAAPGPSCGTGHLFVEAGKLVVAACGISFPDQGSDMGPLHWERGVLATKPSESVDKCVPSISAENM